MHPAQITTDGGEARVSEQTTVTFDPIAGGNAVSVAVVVDGKDDDHDQVKLFDDVEYRMTATATGGTNCTAAYAPDTKPKNVTVACEPSATVLPKGGGTP